MQDKVGIYKKTCPLENPIKINNICMNAQTMGDMYKCKVSRVNTNLAPQIAKPQNNVDSDINKYLLIQI